MNLKTRRLPLIALLLMLIGVGVSSAQDNAPMLRYGEPVDGTLASGASVTYHFQAEAGDPLIIIVNTKGGEIDPVVELYAPDGSLLGRDDNGGGKRNARLANISAPSAGIYTVVVTNQMPGAGGSYALIVKNATQVIAFRDDPTAPSSALSPNYIGYQLDQPWTHTNLSYVMLNTLSNFDQGSVQQIIANAFQAWANDTPLQFTQISSQNADIQIKFTQIDGPENILGQTCLPSGPCSGSVELDTDENWVLNQPQAYNDISLLGVATHELGHVVGLLHSSDPNALMYPEYSPYNLQPSGDDIAGVQRLYGAGQGGVLGAPTAAPGSGGNQGEGNVVTSTISDNQYVEFWDFDVDAGEYVTVTMQALSGGLDPLLIIIDADNNVIAYDDDSAGDLDAVVRNIRFPQSGTYTVAATRFEQVQGYTEGDYQLTLEFGMTNAPTTGSIASTALPTGGGSVQASRATADMLQSETPLDSVLDRDFVDSLTPLTQQSSGTVSASQPYIWSLTWCATGDAALERSLNGLSVSFAVEGQTVPANVVSSQQEDQNGLFCMDYFVQLSGWSGSSVLLTATLSFSQPTFDGKAIYQPGDYVYQYALTVR